MPQRFARRSLPVSDTTRRRNLPPPLGAFHISQALEPTRSTDPRKETPPASAGWTRLSCPQGTSLGRPRLLARRCQGEHNKLLLDGGAATGDPPHSATTPFVQIRYQSLGLDASAAKRSRCDRLPYAARSPRQYLFLSPATATTQRPAPTTVVDDPDRCGNPENRAEQCNLRACT